MIEALISIAVIGALIRYVWVSLKREVEDEDPDPVAAIDSIRAAMPVEVRESDFAPLQAANTEFSRRPRVRAISSLPNLKGTSTS